MCFVFNMKAVRFKLKPHTHDQQYINNHKSWIETALDLIQKENIHEKYLSITYTYWKHVYL